MAALLHSQLGSLYYALFDTWLDRCGFDLLCCAISEPFTLFSSAKPTKARGDCQRFHFGVGANVRNNAQALIAVDNYKGSLTRDI